MRRRAQGFTLIEIMVVMAIIAGLVTTVAIVVPQMQERQKRLACMNNLQQLGHLYIQAAMDNRPKASKYSGCALWLSYRKDHVILKGDERSLTCPGDNIAPPDTDAEKQKYDDVNLDNPPDDLCSYAARNFKDDMFSAEQTEKEILGCDRQGANGATMQHKNVINIVYYPGGDCQPVSREELGVNSEEPIKIGPEAQNANLRKVIYRMSKAQHE